MITNRPVKIFNKKKDDTHPFLKPFMLVINGGCGTGKTNIACNVLDIIDHEKKGYNQAFYFSQAGKLDDTLNDCINVDDVELIQTTRELLEKLEELKQEQEERVDEGKKKIKTLLIVDDTTGSDFVKSNTVTGKRLINILKLHRHLALSVIFIQHRVTVVNPAIRGITNFWIIFPVSDEELKLIAENTKLPKKEIIKHYNECVKDLHDYIMIDNIKRNIYCKNDKVMFEKVYSQFGK